MTQRNARKRNRDKLTQFKVRQGSRKRKKGQLTSHSTLLGLGLGLGTWAMVACLRSAAAAVVVLLLLPPGLAL
jgi:hypothetical protein